MYHPIALTDELIVELGKFGAYIKSLVPDVADKFANSLTTNDNSPPTEIKQVTPTT